MTGRTRGAICPGSGARGSEDQQDVLLRLNNSPADWDSSAVPALAVAAGEPKDWAQDAAGKAGGLGVGVGEQGDA